MSIASEITRLQGVKSDILQAISDKGVTVPIGSDLAACPALIGDIAGSATVRLQPIIPVSGGIRVCDADGYVGGNYMGMYYPQNYNFYNNFAIVVDGADFSSSGLGTVTFATPGTDIIGGRQYRTVTMPDQKVWLAENLDFKFSGCDIGPSSSPSTPAAWYFNNNETDYGIDGTYKCGLLYNWYAVNLLETNKLTLIPGWHVPTKAEYDYLAALLGGRTTAGKVLKAINESIASGTWPTNWNGTDDYTFTLLPSGYRNSSSEFSSLNIRGYLWTSSTKTSSNAYNNYCENGSNDNLYSDYLNYNYACTVRLTKDPVYGTATIGGKTYKTCIIGNREWLAENLDYQFEGCSIAPSGVPSTPAAWYYSDDEATYGWNGYKLGLLYNNAAMQYLEANKATLCPGWHVPSDDDFNDLATALGGLSIAGLAMKCLSTPLGASWYGADVNGFNFLPSGWRGTGTDFGGLGSSGTIRGVTNTFGCGTGDSTGLEPVTRWPVNGMTTRLVRDIT